MEEAKKVLAGVEAAKVLTGLEESLKRKNMVLEAGFLPCARLAHLIL